MSWIAILGVALLAFAIAAVALKLPRGGYALFAATLLFGLTGYAWQSSPGYGGAPKSAEDSARDSGVAMVEARRAMFDEAAQPSYYITVADGFARKGKFADAAKILRVAVRDEPRNPEAWLALANALVEHADGQPTPAALVAFRRAEAAAPDHPGAAYFMGVAWLRSGNPLEARRIWQDTLDNAAPDAPWREELAMQLARLDAMLEVAPTTMPPPQDSQ